MRSESIQVVVAAPPMNVGGTEQHLLHILPELSKRGFDITAVLLGKGGALEAPLREGVSRVIVPSLAFPRPLRTLEQARLIRTAVSTSKARLVHAFLSEPYFAAAAAMISLTGPRPKLVHGRRSLAFYAGEHPWAQKAEIAIHRLSTALVGNSNAVAQELVQEAGSTAKVCLIPNGIPLGGAVTSDERNRARAAFGLPSEAFVMSLVANFHTYKGHADLIEALARIGHSLPSPWRLLLPGRDGGSFDQILARIEHHALTENIVLPGEWPGSREPYSAADVGILVSHTEGFSNSLIEGMAAGLPMIATRVGGNCDAIKDFETGLLIEPHSPDDIGRAILALAASPELRQRLGAAARRMALAHYSLDKCVDRYECLWRSLADDRAGTPADWLAAVAASTTGPD